MLFAELTLVDNEEFFAFLCLENGIVLWVHEVELVVDIVSQLDQGLLTIHSRVGSFLIS